MSELTITGTKGDQEHKRIINRILTEGAMDENPRPHYKDGTPAHTISYNGEMSTYDFSKGDSPLITLRPIAVKSAIGEILWIWQDESNDLSVLENRYGVKWWRPWADRKNTIGQCYGATNKRYQLMRNLLKNLKENPFSRRHIMSLWQEPDLHEPHGLDPCAFMTMWNVRNSKEDEKIKYLDMTLCIRSSDFCTACCLNVMQYAVLMYMVAAHCAYTPGKMNVFIQNVHIYDRHIEAAKELISRESIACKPQIKLNPYINDFYSFTQKDIYILGYPMDEIKLKNPQITIFRDEIAI